MKKAIQYGAGNIGRGFLAQLFTLSGYEVVFIDVNSEIVNKLNEDRQYPLKTVANSGDHEFIIGNVRAINGIDVGNVSDEIASADIMATAVGVNIIPKITHTVALGLQKRWAAKNMQPFNIIICENLLHANKFMADLIKENLSDQEICYFDETVGLVEASIGRMVPVMTSQMQDGNILRICVEEYTTLPVDKEAFKGEIPLIKHMIPFSPFDFYIQRKLFIHNLGHAIVAYLGYLSKNTLIYEAIKNPDIKHICIRAMQESALALSLEHNVPLKDIQEHIDDLIQRFGNSHLGDTVERVGKDPLRKLSPNDRLIGALNLSRKHGGNPVYICIGIAAALCFRSENDASLVQLQKEIDINGVKGVLENHCGIQNRDDLNIINKFYNILHQNTTLDEVIEIATQSY